MSFWWPGPSRSRLVFLLVKCTRVGVTSEETPMACADWLGPTSFQEHEAAQDKGSRDSHQTKSILTVCDPYSTIAKLLDADILV